jgi:hypothetical protein
MIVALLRRRSLDLKNQIGKEELLKILNILFPK